MGRPRKNVSQEKIQQLKRELELAGNRTDVLLQDKRAVPGLVFFVEEESNDATINYPVVPPV